MGISRNNHPIAEDFGKQFYRCVSLPLYCKKRELIKSPPPVGWGHCCTIYRLELCLSIQHCGDTIAPYIDDYHYSCPYSLAEVHEQNKADLTPQSQKPTQAPAVPTTVSLAYHMLTSRVVQSDSFRVVLEDLTWGRRCSLL